MKRKMYHSKHFHETKLYYIYLIILSLSIHSTFQKAIASRAVSVFSVAPIVKVCDREKLRGPCKGFTRSVLNLAGRKWPNSRSSMNNDITSINVRSGWNVTACSKKMFGGRCKDFKANSSPSHFWSLGKYQLKNTVESFEITRNISRWKKAEYLQNHPGGKIKAGGGREGVDWAEEAQGITHDADYWYITQKDKLYKYHVKKNLSQNGYIKRVGLPDKCQHFGDLDYYRGYLYIALEKCPTTNSQSKARIYVYDRNLKKVKVAHLRKPDGKKTDKAAWVAVNPVNGYMYTANQDKKNMLQVYSRSFRSGGRVKPIYEIELRYDDHEEKVGLIQGGVFSNNGLLYLSNDRVRRRMRPGIYVYQIRGRRGDRRNRIEDKDFKKARGHELEGITLWDMDADTRGRSAKIPGGQIHYIFLDNDSNGDDVYLRHIRVSHPD